MKRILSLIILAFLLTAAVSAQQKEEGFTPVAFDNTHWSLEGAKVQQYQNRTALNGAAMLKDLQFQNGVVKVDIFTSTKRRSYPGVLFRFLSPTDYERVYIRPHRSGLYPDTVQYVPSFSGIDSWQLYNGPGFTSIAEIPSETWFTLTIDISGSQAKIFVGDQPQPSLVITDLKHGIRKGMIGLSGNVDNLSFFSNFRYKINPDTPVASMTAETENIPGIIRDWELSKPYKELELTFDEYTAPDTNKMEWQKVQAERNGMLDISRFLTVEQIPVEPARIYARTTIHSDREQIRRFLFGYSDIVRIYFNGRIIFSGDSTYRSRDLSFLGIVGLFDSVYLPLKKGDNELIFAVTEQMGGWGLMCRDADETVQDSSLSLEWKLNKTFKIPESAAYDPDEKTIYVSNYDAYNRSFVEGRQSISKISLDGKVIDLNWSKGLFNPTGLTIYNHMLYAVERTGVAEIELMTGKIINRFKCENAVMLNDITIAKDGTVFVSDSIGAKIYKIKDGVSEVLLASPELAGINGVLAGEGKLFVLTNGDGCLKEISLENKKIQTIAELDANTLDGLQFDENGNFMLSKYDGRLYRVTSDGKITRLLDFTGPETYISDFFYDKNEKRLIMPTFLDNSLMSYTFKKK